MEISGWWISQMYIIVELIRDFKDNQNVILYSNITI